MKKTIFTTIVCILIFAGIAYSRQTGPVTPDPWPRTAELSGVKYTIYQPQIDSWDGFTLKAQILPWQTSTKTSSSRRTVLYFSRHGPLWTGTSASSTLRTSVSTRPNSLQPRDMAQTYLEQTRKALPKKMKSVSLDRAEASMAILEQQKKSQVLPFKNDPPKIIFSSRPSLLVFIDGEPRFTPVKDSDLARVLNTRVLMLKDATGKLYLHIFDGWMESQTFQGSWGVSTSTPKDIKEG